LKRICSRAFYDTALTVIRLPSSSCFIECDALPAGCEVTRVDDCFSFASDFGLT
jgi:hypothetical protein